MSARAAWGVWVSGRAALFGPPEGWSRDGETGLTLVTDEAEARMLARAYTASTSDRRTAYEARPLPAALVAQVAQLTRAAAASRRPRPPVVPPPRDLIPYRVPAAPSPSRTAPPRRTRANPTRSMPTVEQLAAAMTVPRGTILTKPIAAPGGYGSKPGTAAELTKQLIMVTGGDNAAVHAALVRQLGAAAAGPAKNVGWYRNWLKREGHNPPAGR